MTGSGKDVVRFRLRLTNEAHVRMKALAEQRGVTMSALLRKLLAEPVAGSPSQAGSGQAIDALELQLHLLIAVEQVLALIESFLPEGRGAATRVLEEAALAAQRRLAGLAEAGQR